MPLATATRTAGETFVRRSRALATASRSPSAPAAAASITSESMRNRAMSKPTIA